MRRRLIVGAMVALAVVFCFIVATYAADRQAADWKEEALRKGEQDLNSREWVIYVRPQGEKAAGVETDMLTFQNGKLTSKNLSAQGYPESNYGLSVNEDGGIIWETMQARELPNQVDLAFLRGELFNDGSMRGTISLQPHKGAKKRFAFSTEMQARQAEAPVTQATPAPAKKKKGWR